MTDQTSKGAYQPGLDGLRAVAVGAVLLFHSGYGWARGGFLGVSVFFTLSGFLITGLLLGEIDRTGRIRLRTFWSRRARRLLPASTLCLLLVAAFLPLFAAAGRPAVVRADVVAALGHVANWRFVLAHKSYADLFATGPTPVLHFWSLAVEEQFYVVVPVVLALAAWAARRTGKRWLPVAMLIGLLALSLGSVFVTHSRDLSYYGTQTRAAEFLIGGLCAVWRRSSAGSLSTDRLPLLPSWSVRMAGGAALLATMWFVHTVRQTDEWLYRGGFAALGVLWCALIVGALSAGPVRDLLSWGPLLQLGKLSYGVYLFHWPVYQLITASRLGSAGAPLFAVRLIVTSAFAVASYRWLEQPVRSRRWSLHGGRAFVVLASSMLLIVGVTAVRSNRAAGAALSPMLTAPDHVVELGLHLGAPGSTVPVEPTNVVVIGAADADLSAVIAAVAAAGPDVHLIDLTQKRCGAFLGDLAPSSCQPVRTRLATYLTSTPRVAAVVLAVGPAEHDASRGRLAGASRVDQAATLAEFGAIENDARLVDGLRTTVGIGPELVVLDDSSGNALSAQLLIATVRTQDATLTTSDGVGDVLRTAIEREQHSSPKSDRLRVMVIGDSTSYGVALELDRQAPDKLEVVWAGRRNCPIAPATDLRWWPGAEFTMQDCLAGQLQWSAVAARLHPDALIVVESLPEHSDQRYAGDRHWYGAGDARFAQEHDTAMQHLLDIVAPYHATVMMSDSAHGSSSTPARVEAWNGLLAGWAVKWSIRILPLAAFVEGAEAAAGHSLRPDGMHMDDATQADAVAKVYLPQLLQLLAAHTSAAMPVHSG